MDLPSLCIPSQSLYLTFFLQKGIAIMVKRKASAVISKTKAKATTRKPAVVKVRTGSDTPGQVLLAKLMEQHMMENDSVSFADIMKGLGMNDRNTGWRNAWKDLVTQGYIESSSSDGGGFFTSGFQLTKTGIELGATDEYKQVVSSMPQTNNELHEKIKGKLMNKRGEEIFDLLVKQGPMSRMELSGALGISDRGAYFSYALQQLKDLAYVEVDPTAKGKDKKVRLTDKAFIVPPTTAAAEKVIQDSKSMPVKQELE
jgi:predicted ArsR family transcriptional regulator